MRSISRRERSADSQRCARIMLRHGQEAPLRTVFSVGRVTSFKSRTFPESRIATGPDTTALLQFRRFQQPIGMHHRKVLSAERMMHCSSDLAIFAAAHTLETLRYDLATAIHNTLDNQSHHLWLGRL